MAFCFAIRWTPRARVMVRIAGSPSGIAATARATTARNASDGGKPRSSHPTRKTRTLAATMATESCFPKRSMIRMRGVGATFTRDTISPIRPISVEEPVATTTPVIRPEVMRVPE
jgi:hypothetical protein